MKAHEIKTSIGKLVITEPMGSWPGGLATITGMCNDDDFILFYVKSEDPDVHAEHGEMGIFHDEQIELITD